jgi:hypothetical protein
LCPHCTLYSVQCTVTVLNCIVNIVNPNPHYCIYITKAVARGGKDPFLPHPLHSPAGRRGQGCFLWRPEDWLNKHVSYTSIIIKTTLKKIFFLLFLGFFCLRPLCTYLHWLEQGLELFAFHTSPAERWTLEMHMLSTRCRYSCS